MNINKPLNAAGNALLDFDHQTHELCTQYAGTPRVKALDLVSKLGDQPELRFIAAALIAAGTFGGSDRLMRAGARMTLTRSRLLQRTW